MLILEFLFSFSFPLPKINQVPSATQHIDTKKSPIVKANLLWTPSIASIAIFSREMIFYAIETKSIWAGINLLIFLMNWWRIGNPHTFSLLPSCCCYPPAFASACRTLIEEKEKNTDKGCCNCCCSCRSKQQCEQMSGWIEKKIDIVQ